MNPAVWLGTCVCLVVAAAGCIDDRRGPTAGPQCPPGQTCGVNPSSAVGAGVGAGSGGAGGDGSGSGGGGAVLAGNVVLITESTFAKGTIFTGEATVSAPKAGGGAVSAKVGGAAGTTFEISDVQAGDGWVLAHVASAGADVFSGYSVQHVPDASAQVPVVDRAVILDIALTVPGQPDLADGAAHVAIALEQMGQPLEGVEVTGGAPGALVLYDTGVAGEYSDQATGTGKAGRILLLNVTPTASDTITLSIKGAGGIPFAPLQLAVAPETVTLAGFQL